MGESHWWPWLVGLWVLCKPLLELLLNPSGLIAFIYVQPALCCGTGECDNRHGKNMSGTLKFLTRLRGLQCQTRSRVELRHSQARWN